jgi:hypothetical protein
MSNRFNYRCPRCHSQDYITICASLNVRLTSTGTTGEASNLGPDDWCCESGAGCDACGFEGAVKDFESSGGATVVSIQSRMRGAR